MPDPRPSPTPEDIETAHAEALLDDLYHDWPGEPATLGDDCCPGEPAVGDPRGLHTEDCPAYLAMAATLDARTRAANEQARVARMPDPIALAYAAGHRHGLEEAARLHPNRRP